MSTLKPQNNLRLSQLFVYVWAIIVLHLSQIVMVCGVHAASTANWSKNHGIYYVKQIQPIWHSTYDMPKLLKRLSHVVYWKPIIPQVSYGGYTEGTFIGVKLANSWAISTNVIMTNKDKCARCVWFSTVYKSLIENMKGSI